MSHKMFLYSSVFVFTLLYGCKNNNPKTTKYEYYKSGKLKNVGVFIKDSIPIDTMKTYFENGLIKNIEVRDDSGVLNGVSSVFYKTGGIKSLLPYINGLEQGYAYFFSGKGAIEAKAFYFNNLQVGDIYYFDSLQKIDGYRFRDFKGKSLLQIDYNFDGSINKENRQSFFLDSFILQPQKVRNIKKEKDCKILLIIANPPRSHNSIIINFLSGGKIYKSVDVPHGQFYKNTVTVFDNTDSIIVIGKQYDSISQRETYEKSISPVLKE